VEKLEDPTEEKRKFKERVDFFNEKVTNDNMIRS